jgi:hypothetical protein
VYKFSFAGSKSTVPDGTFLISTVAELAGFVKVENVAMGGKLVKVSVKVSVMMTSPAELELAEGEADAVCDHPAPYHGGNRVTEAPVSVGRADVFDSLSVEETGATIDEEEYTEDEAAAEELNAELADETIVMNPLLLFTVDEMKLDWTEDCERVRVIPVVADDVEARVPGILGAELEAKVNPVTKPVLLDEADVGKTLSVNVMEMVDVVKKVVAEPEEVKVVPRDPTEVGNSELELAETWLIESCSEEVELVADDATEMEDAAVVPKTVLEELMEPETDDGREVPVDDVVTEPCEFFVVPINIVEALDETPDTVRLGEEPELDDCANDVVTKDAAVDRESTNEELKENGNEEDVLNSTDELAGTPDELEVDSVEVTIGPTNEPVAEEVSDMLVGLDVAEDTETGGGMGLYIGGITNEVEVRELLERDVDTGPNVNVDRLKSWLEDDTTKEFDKESDCVEAGELLVGLPEELKVKAELDDVLLGWLLLKLRVTVGGGLRVEPSVETGDMTEDMTGEVTEETGSPVLELKINAELLELPELKVTTEVEEPLKLKVKLGLGSEVALTARLELTLRTELRDSVELNVKLELGKPLELKDGVLWLEVLIAEDPKTLVDDDDPMDDTDVGNPTVALEMLEKNVGNTNAEVLLDAERLGTPEELGRIMLELRLIDTEIG